MADMYLVSNTDMVGVADEIRAKSGKSGALVFPVGWKEALNSMKSEEKLLASEYQDYIHDGVLELVNKVRSVQTADTITFLATSDPHYPAEQTATTEYESNKASTVLASKASKALAYMLNLDFTAFMGDACIGAASTTPDMAKKQMEDYLSFFDEANSDVPCFLAIGNHDTGIYYHNAQTDGKVHTMTGEYLYNLFTSKSASENTVFGGIQNGGYCYRDFPDKKLRVFLLNTSEKLVDLQKDQAMYGAQRLWLANALIDLNSKSDASQWKFLTLAHYPADYGNTMPLSQLLKAYIEGTSFTIADPNSPNNGYYVGDDTNVTVSFSGKNSAKFIAHFHGHIHNFLYSKMYVDGSPLSNSIQYDGVRVCIPNAQFNRENTYDTVGDRTGISFKDTNAYLKTANTKNGTSFVVNVIDPNEEVIHSFCFGAGYDRLISFGATRYYRVTYDLTNFESSETIISVEENTSYSTVLTKAIDEHEVKTLTVTMGGEDVTSAVYSNGIITIPKVTGDIVITAKAQMKANFTNQITISKALDSDAVYNGKGYKEGTYVSSTGADGNKSGYYATGLIPATKGDVIRLENFGFVNGDQYSRIVLFNANKEKLTNAAFGGTNFGTAAGFNAVFDGGGYLTEFTLNHAYCNNMAFFRIGGQYIGDDSVITRNEKISYGTPVYDIASTLNYATSSNTAATIKQGETYTTTLTSETGYTLTTVTVTMGGVDVTSAVYSNGVITIPNVTGDIEITATASKPVTYTNVLKTAYTPPTANNITPIDTSVFDGVGYRNGVRLSGWSLSSNADYVTTGVIRWRESPGAFAGLKPIYIKGATLDLSKSYVRVNIIQNNNGGLYLSATSVSGTNWNTYFTIETLGENYYKLTPIESGISSWYNIICLQFSLFGKGDNLIITIDEPIE